MRRALALVLVLLAIHCPRVCFAAPWDNQPKILLHIKATTTKNACTTWGDLADCKDAVTEANLTPIGGPGYYYVYLLVAEGGEESVAGLQCGIAYENNLASDITNSNQVDVFGWTNCATLEFITPRSLGNVWPEPGGGNLITWDPVARCQIDGVAVAGYFYVAGYTAGTMRVTKRPTDMIAKTADCNSRESAPLGNEDLGSIAFSTGAVTLGCNPCDANCQPSPVEAMITPTPPGLCLPPPGDCTEIPIVIDYQGTDQVRAYSIRLQLGSAFSICEGGIVQGSYLSSAAPTSFHVTDEGAGIYTVDCTVLGTTCRTGPSMGTLFTVPLVRASAVGTQLLTVLSTTVRDCANQPITSSAGTHNLDVTAPAPITGLTAVEQRSGNGPGQVVGVQVSFDIPFIPSEVEVYRAPFGGYPAYDNAGGHTPTAPVYPPGFPWVPTGLTTSGQIDYPPSRDSWYYVAFARDSCLNYSPPSDFASSLNYHLGDVHDEVTDCVGNNRVGTEDLSYLGAYYGMSVSPMDSWACLDVGPTVGGSASGRPLTDGQIQFEDLVIFGLNFGSVSQPGYRPARKAGDADEVWVEAVTDPLRPDVLQAVVHTRATGVAQAVSLAFRWGDELVPTGFRRGTLASEQPGQLLMLSPAPGQIDMTFLGTSALEGSGILAIQEFRRIAERAGPGTVEIAKVIARDSDNHPVRVTIGAGSPSIPVAPGVPLGVPYPNPSTGQVRIPYEVVGGDVPEISIVDASGRLVRRLPVSPGTASEVSWDGRDDQGREVSNGVYFIRLMDGDVSHSRTIQVVRSSVSR